MRIQYWDVVTYKRIVLVKPTIGLNLKHCIRYCKHWQHVPETVENLITPAATGITVRDRRFAPMDNPNFYGPFALSTLLSYLVLGAK